MCTVNEIHEAYLSGKAVGRCQGARGDTSALDTKVEILTASNSDYTKCAEKIMVSLSDRSGIDLYQYDSDIVDEIRNSIASIISAHFA